MPRALCQFSAPHRPHGDPVAGRYILRAVTSRHRPPWIAAESLFHANALQLTTLVGQRADRPALSLARMVELNPTEANGLGQLLLGPWAPSSPLRRGDRIAIQHVLQHDLGRSLSRQRSGRAGILLAGVCSTGSITPTPTGPGPGGFRLTTDRVFEANPTPLTTHGRGWMPNVSQVSTVAVCAPTGAATAPLSNRTGLWPHQRKGGSHQEAGLVGEQHASRSMPIPSAVGGKPTLKGCEEVFVTPWARGRRQPALLLASSRRRGRGSISS